MFSASYIQYFLTWLIFALLPTIDIQLSKQYNKKQYRLTTISLFISTTIILFVMLPMISFCTRDGFLILFLLLLFAFLLFIWQMRLCCCKDKCLNNQDNQDNQNNYNNSILEEFYNSNNLDRQTPSKETCIYYCVNVIYSVVVIIILILIMSGTIDNGLNNNGLNNGLENNGLKVNKHYKLKLGDRAAFLPPYHLIDHYAVIDENSDSCGCVDQQLSFLPFKNDDINNNLTITSYPNGYVTSAGSTGNGIGTSIGYMQAKCFGGYGFEVSQLVNFVTYSDDTDSESKIFGPEQWGRVEYEYTGVNVARIEWRQILARLGHYEIDGIKTTDKENHSQVEGKVNYLEFTYYSIYDWTFVNGIIHTPEDSVLNISLSVVDDTRNNTNNGGDKKYGKSKINEKLATQHLIQINLHNGTNNIVSSFIWPRHKYSNESINDKSVIKNINNVIKSSSIILNFNNGENVTIIMMSLNWTRSIYNYDPSYRNHFLAFIFPFSSLYCLIVFFYYLCARGLLPHCCERHERYASVINNIQ